MALMPRRHVLSPLHVEAVTDKDGNDVFETTIGPRGKRYDLRFNDLMNLVRSRYGCTRKLLAAPNSRR